MSEEEIEMYKSNNLAGYDQHESIAYPAWSKLTQAHAFVFDLARFVEATRIGRVLINRIRPGGRIYPHADTPAHTEYYKRFHLVIQGQPGAVITCGDESLQMLTGRLFYFDNKLVHEVRNESSVDRISMVIDLKCGSND
jgi:mannose-6-phosphate isomerase-like protein (cupin superfamily)